LYESSLVDDFLFGQPVNVLPRLFRSWGARRRPRSPGVSVVIASFNTIGLLQTAVSSVRRFSPPETEILVIDNASDDGSAEWLRNRRSECRSVRLPVNLGHGRALDIGFALADFPTVVTLDSDAFPYSKRWLDLITAPLEDGFAAAGMWGRRDRLHPACSAYRRADFFASKMSFGVFNPHLERGEHEVFGTNTWDTGELLFERLGRSRVALLPVERSPHGGLTMLDAVYHHGASTTLSLDDRGGSVAAHQRAWDDAVADYLGT
jgi:glycosyltransferase involved in cell wall biosynthesis